jgi:LVIVD repeat
MAGLLRMLVPAGLVAALAFAVPAGSQVEPDQHSRNMSLIANVPGVENPATPGVSFTNSDLAFWGTRAIAGDYGGFRIFAIQRPQRPRLLANFRCNGPQNDVSVWGGLLFQSIDSPQTTSMCNSSSTTHAATPGAFEGIRIFDISDPRNPSLIKGVQTDCGSHTHTLVPDLANGRVLIYVSSYALTAGSLGPECLADTGTTKGHNKISIVAVPLANPAAASVIAEPALDPGTQQFDGNAFIPGLGLLTTTGCHDITVFVELEIAAASCLSEGQFWDISNPASPQFIYRVDNPNIGAWHNAAFTWDGKYIAFGDEAGGGVFPECEATDPDTKGAIWLYRWGETTATSHFKIPRFETEHCTAHNFNWIPTRKHYTLVGAWYAGGTSVVSFDDPANPREVGWYKPMNPHGASWSSYWYNGEIYSNDIERGLDVFRLTGRSRSGAGAGLPFDNPQTQMNVID